MDKLYENFFEPARGHNDKIDYDHPEDNVLLKPVESLIGGTFASFKRKKVVTPAD